MLSEMCDVDPVSYKCGVALSLASMKQVHVGVSNTFVFARQHKLWQIVTIIFFSLCTVCLHYTVSLCNEKKEKKRVCGLIK